MWTECANLYIEFVPKDTAIMLSLMLDTSVGRIEEKNVQKLTGQRCPHHRACLWNLLGRLFSEVAHLPKLHEKVKNFMMRTQTHFLSSMLNTKHNLTYNVYCIMI